MTPRHLFYLHGFASSAKSSKATFLAERLAAQGVTLRCPDFNQPDFRTLTVTRMLAQLAREIDQLPSGPVCLIGSSLGAFVAVHAAAHSRSGRHPVDRLVLLAPALDFTLKNDRHIGAEKLAEWRHTDRLTVFHFGDGRLREVGFALYEDAQQYDVFNVQLGVPVLAFQGRRDDSVDPAMVEQFARERPEVTLRLLDDDHQLLGSLDQIWTETAKFLEIPSS